RCAGRHALPEALEALTQALAAAEKLGEPRKSQAQFELREQLGLLYRLMGQLTAAAAEFQHAFELARQHGDVACQLKAQLWLAGVASFLDRDRCLSAVDTVIGLCKSGEAPSELRANALGQVAYWNLLFRGWDERDGITSAAALEAARKSNDPTLLALHASRHAFFQCLSSQYR